MKRLVVCGSLIVSAALLSACVTALAQTDGSTARPQDSGSASVPGIANAEKWPDSVRSRVDGLSADANKALYLQCTEESIERHLGGGEAAFCSIVYDVLLKRYFAGDFGALLAWSRRQHAAVELRHGLSAAQSTGSTEATAIASQRGPRF